MLRARKLLPWVGLVMLVALPVVGSLLRYEREGWFPESDDATIVLLSGDTFRDHPPLVGMISTGGAELRDPELHHPGPIELYVLAPLTRSGLGPATGAAVTAALVAVSSVVAMVVGATWLGGRRWAAAGAVTAALVLWSMGADAPVSVWNPYVVVLPFAAFLVFAAAAARGDDRALVGVVGAGSFVAQTHLSYVGLIGLVTAWLTVLTVWRLSRAARSDEGRDRRPHLVAVALGVALWLPPVADQVRGQPGNLGQIWRSLTGGGGPTVGLDALGELGRVVGVPVLGLRPPATMVRVLAGASPWGLLAATVPWAVLAGLSVVAWRRRERAATAVGATVAVTLVAGFLTAPRIPTSDGLLYDYYALWMRPVAAVVWLLLAWIAWQVRPAALTRAGSAVVRHRAAPALVVLAVAAVSVLPRPGAWEPWRAHRRVAGEVAPATAGALPTGGTYVVRFRGASPYLSTGSAVVLALADRGNTVLVDPGAPTPVFPWGEHRRYRNERVDAEVWVVSGPAPTGTPAHGRLTGRAPTLDDGQVAALRRLEDRVRRAVDRHGVRPGPRPPTDDRREAVEAALADPTGALSSGALADAGARGMVEVTGVSAHDLFTLQRLRMLADEGEVRVYVVEASQRR